MSTGIYQPNHRDPFGMGYGREQEAIDRLHDEYAKKAKEATEKATAELRAELAVQQAIVAELARRLALKQLPPEA